MKIFLLPLLLCLQMACTFSSTPQNKIISPAFWADSLVNQLDSVLLDKGYEWWLEGKRQTEYGDTVTLEEVQQTYSFQNFKDKHVFSKRYEVDALHQLIVLGMAYGDNAFEVLLLTKEEANARWWLSGALTCYTRFVLEERHLWFDVSTGLLLLSIGDFYSDRGDANTRMIYQVEDDRLIEAGSVDYSGFFDLELEWDAADDTTAPCAVGGLYFYHSDWRIINKETLVLDYIPQVLLTNEAPYPWPDADTILLDTFTVVYTWQDSLQAFGVDEKQSPTISTGVLENRQNGDWDRLFLNDLLQCMRKDTSAMYYQQPCVQAALLDERLPRQVYD